MCVCVCWLHVCLGTVCVPGALGAQKRPSDQQQPVLLTVDPSLQPHPSFLLMLLGGRGLIKPRTALEDCVTKDVSLFCLRLPCAGITDVSLCPAVSPSAAAPAHRSVTSACRAPPVQVSQALQWFLTAKPNDHILVPYTRPLDGICQSAPPTSPNTSLQSCSAALRFPHSFWLTHLFLGLPSLNSWCFLPLLCSFHSVSE